MLGEFDATLHGDVVGIELESLLGHTLGTSLAWMLGVCDGGLDGAKLVMKSESLMVSNVYLENQMGKDLVMLMAICLGNLTPLS